MLNIVGRRIFMASLPMDMRRGMDRLAAWVEGQAGHDPFAGDVYVFLSKNNQRVKVLVWDVTGYWLAMKRLDRGRFARPHAELMAGDDRALALSAAELSCLLEGISIHGAAYHQHHARSAEK